MKNRNKKWMWISLIVVALIVGWIVGYYSKQTPINPSCNINSLNHKSLNVYNEGGYAGYVQSSVCYNKLSISEPTWKCFLNDVDPTENTCGINGCSAFSFKCDCYS